MMMTILMLMLMLMPMMMMMQMMTASPWLEISSWWKSDKTSSDSPYFDDSLVSALGSLSTNKFVQSSGREEELCSLLYTCIMLNEVLKFKR